MTGHQNFHVQSVGSATSKGTRLPLSILLFVLLLTRALPVMAQKAAPAGASQSPAPVIDLADTDDSHPGTESRAARIVRQLSLPAAKRAQRAALQPPSLPAPQDQRSHGAMENASQNRTESPSAALAAHPEPAGPHAPDALTPKTKRTNYVVQRGDTLAGIFKRQGLPARTLQRVLDADRGAARTFAHIRPGQVLVIERDHPGGALLGLTLKQGDRSLARVVLPTEARTTTNPTALRTVRHRIKRGETLSRIFKRYGLSARTLQLILHRHPDKARRLSRLRPGQYLQLELDRPARLLALRLEGKRGTPLTIRMEHHSTDREAATLATRAAAATPETNETPAAATKPAPIEPLEDPTAAAQATADEPVVSDEKATAVADEGTPVARVETHRIKSGETLASIFNQYGLTPGKVYQVLHAGKAAKDLSLIRPGQQLELAFDADGELISLTLVKSPVEKLVVVRQGESYRASVKKKTIERRLATVEGIIHSSLFADGHQAGLTDGQVMELAEIFGWDIDFALEIQPGDQFRVVYEELFVDGEKYRNGPILAAEFVNRGKTYQAFRFEHDGQIGYYDAKGRSKRRAFIRTPIRFARISSRFQPRRWHPILKKWKSHKGVDYAAPRGTPIKVTGDGRVVFRGWKRGYGRVVIVQHSGKYRTVYAHMSKFRSSVRKGTRVRQGQVIGYVGSSGWATGPHLHYEFRVNNVQRNPLTVKLPHSLPLPKRQFAAFKRQTAPLMRQLAALRARHMVASSSD
ncbi:MAG: LysM peptidoglycan-binding domain-containing protein [Gammaproteobacteria bacterium]|nr:MAG: LysM peptidoglycan-binding domain-containing protein [Gammaproteobacteria bacterium]